MKKLTLLLLLLIFSCDSTSKINDEVVATIKNEIQNDYSTPSRNGKYYLGYGERGSGEEPFKVDKLRVVHISNNEYLGELYITNPYSGIQSKKEVKVFYDGRSFIWELTGGYSSYRK